MNSNRLLTIVMVVAGVILLLPGVCSLVFIGLMGREGANPTFVVPWAMCFLISFGGFWLIRTAIR